MMSRLQAALSSNSRALNFLQEGKLVDSQAELAMALGCLRSVVADENNQDPETAADSLAVEFVLISNLDHPVGEGVFPLFNRGIGLSSGPNLSTSTAALRKLTAFLLYNYGLSKHLLGLSFGCSQHISNALRLYQLAASIVFEIETHIDIEEDLSVLWVALLNNMGHIHDALLIDNKEAANCYRLMEQAVASIASRPESAFFYRTLVIFANWPSPPASAA